jgi:hypothetical protein
MMGNTALAALSTRLQRPTFVNLPHVPAITVGTRLDQIRGYASIAAQAAAVARTLAQRNLGVQDALANTNYPAIQTRVLNILNTPPSHELFAQSDRVLSAYVGIIRGSYLPGQPQRIFVENIARALNC